jgi:hypothetical protein
MFQLATREWNLLEKNPLAGITKFSDPARNGGYQVSIFTPEELQEDGSKVDTFGPNPVGILMLDGDGLLSLQEMRSDLPQFGTNNRQEGTADENKAIVQGSICYFGTYTIDEAAKTLIFHLEGCSFPNWNGTEQKRSFTLTGDELTWTGVGSSGRPIHTVWKRAK